MVNGPGFRDPTRREVVSLSLPAPDYREALVDRAERSLPGQAELARRMQCAAATTQPRFAEEDHKGAGGVKKSGKPADELG